MDNMIFLNLIESGSDDPKTYSLQVPIRDQVYNPASSKVVGTLSSAEPWKIPFDVNNPRTAETTDELIGIKSGEKPFSYTRSDLVDNFIELSANQSEQIGTSSTNVSFDCQGCSGRLTMRLCSYPDPQNPSRTLFNSRVTTVYSTAYVNSMQWEQYRNSASWNPDNPWGDRWISPSTDWFNNNAFNAQELTVINGVRPCISFHIETFRNPSWTTGRYIKCLVINHWRWDMTDAEHPVYSIRNQQIISLKYISDDPVTPQNPLTPSTTPNATPNGGRGLRQITPRDVPLPSASQIAALGSGYSGIGEAGIHLYKFSPTNWAGLQHCIWNKDLITKSLQSFQASKYGAKDDLSEYIISNYVIGIPINTSGESGVVQIGALTLDVLVPSTVIAEALSNRFADSAKTYEFNINPYSDTFLDYDPMTKIQVHIPYCGVVSVSPDQCVGGKIQVKYIVDLVTGNCVAAVKAIDKFGTGTIVSVRSGQCGTSRAFIANDVHMHQIFGSIASIATGAATGNPISIAGGATGLINSAVPETKVCGSATVGGLASVMGDLAIYVAVYHPQDITGLSVEGTNQINHFGNKLGYAAASFCRISEINSGEYIEAIVNPNVITTATSAEKESIRRMIQEGVYI